jgi:1-acyl-sn-glycerol-3-phosphate acyltransferase
VTGRLPTGAGATAGWRIAWVVMRTGWSVRVHGAHLVPARGPVILAPNHTGFLDPPLLMGTSPRPIHCLGKREIFRGPLGLFLRSIGQIPIDRSGTDRTALTSALAVLAAGRVLVVYPEGTRGSGDFADLRRGLAWLAVRSGTPVVPVVAFGVGARGTTLSALPPVRSRLDVVFGAPVELPVFTVRSSAAVQEANRRLQAALTAHYAAAAGRFGAGLIVGRPDGETR